MALGLVSSPQYINDFLSKCFWVPFCTNGASKSNRGQSVALGNI